MKIYRLQYRLGEHISHQYWFKNKKELVKKEAELLKEPSIGEEPEIKCHVMEVPRNLRDLVKWLNQYTR